MDKVDKEKQNLFKWSATNMRQQSIKLVLIFPWNPFRLLIVLLDKWSKPYTEGPRTVNILSCLTWAHLHELVNVAPRWGFFLLQVHISFFVLYLQEVSIFFYHFQVLVYMYVNLFSPPRILPSTCLADSYLINLNLCYWLLLFIMSC